MWRKCVMWKNNVYNLWRFVAFYAVLLQNLWFTQFCCNICFVAIYALLRGEKFSQELRSLRKMTNIRYVYVLSQIFRLEEENHRHFHLKLDLVVGFDDGSPQSMTWTQVRFSATSDRFRSIFIWVSLSPTPVTNYEFKICGNIIRARTHMVFSVITRSITQIQIQIQI